MAVDFGTWGSGNCDDCACEGGLIQTTLHDGCNIADVAVDASGVITGFTMTTPGLSGRYVHDNENDASSYNQPAEVVQGKCKQLVQAMTGEVYCLNKDTNDEANKINKSTKVVAVHEMSSGLRLVQGIETKKESDGSYSWKFSKKNATALADVIGGTGAESSKIVLRINSTARSVSPTTSMKMDALAAL